MKEMGQKIEEEKIEKEKVMENLTSQTSEI